MSIWDDAELQNDSEYVKFDAVGDEIAGEVVAVRKQVWDDGKVSPKLDIVTADGETRTVTAGQIRLKAELAAKRPEPGDRIRIRLSDIERRSGGKTLKHFEVEVTRGTGAPASTTTSSGVPF